jgi:hypothetical protein
MQTMLQPKEAGWKWTSSMWYVNFCIPSAIHATFDLERPSCDKTVPVQDILKSDAGEIWHQGVTANLSWRLVTPTVLDHGLCTHDYGQTDFKGEGAAVRADLHRPRWSHYLKTLLLCLRVFEPLGSTAFPIQECLSTRLALVRAFI